ncbi:MAG: TetR/AcrR family transcriptional regulator [Fimbriimonas sp.]
MQTEQAPVQMPEKKRKLIEATVRSIHRQGYAATTVDGICAEAGVTKGSFFHYFASKEEICGAAMEAWAGSWRDILRAARFDELSDPLDRIDRLFETMTACYLRCGPVGGCVIGNVAQELAVTNDRMRSLCESYFDQWRGVVVRFLVEAKRKHSPKVDFDPAEIAMFLMCLVQGTFLLTKTQQNPDVILANLRHAQAYIHSLFGRLETH